MSTTATTSLRLPVELLERADALIPVMASWPEVGAHGRVSRSTVIRIALLRGLASLEAEASRRDGDSGEAQR